MMPGIKSLIYDKMVALQFLSGTRSAWINPKTWDYWLPLLAMRQKVNCYI
jgi:hypothetical protein